MFNDVYENGTRGRSMRCEMKAWRFVTGAEHASSGIPWQQIPMYDHNGGLDLNSTM